MALCAKCGAQVAAGTASCPGCEAAKASSSGPAPRDGAAAVAGSGLSENVAGLFCYLVPFVASAVFLVIDKRPLIKLHAVQSIMFFVCAAILHQILEFAVGFLPGAWDPLALSTYSGIVIGAYWSVIIGFWSVCLRKALRNERFKLPFLGNIAEDIAGK